ncbi:Protein PLANT CADMIUM RESISTANCE 8 [Acorus gramineus]|uniref:Protein PLANT CADMIUM RESISTANCE 8 n=1 Tax=Acorus gramineus TaxID=55184 RepID=A0AAV9AJ77_ACOGR|nr:Protein PLANT CADMIUM RESISTANCE 8 [Acorus gramineus]
MLQQEQMNWAAPEDEVPVQFTPQPEFDVYDDGTSSVYRGRLRQRFNLVEAPTEDWIAHAFCPCCALCQEFRELKNRGIDPSLGK